MREQSNRQVIRRVFEEALQDGNIDLVDSLFSAHFIDHSTPYQPAGTQGVKEYFRQVRTGFPDIEISIEDLIAEGDKIAVRTIWRGTHLGEYEGHAPSGRQVTRSMLQIFYLAEGRIVEEWNEGTGLLG